MPGPGQVLTITALQLTQMIAVAAGGGATGVAAAGSAKAQKIDRPKITQGMLEEGWNTFMVQLEMYKQATGIKDAEVSRQIVYCCDPELMGLVLQADPNTASKTEAEVLKLIKSFVVIPIAMGARRSDMLGMKQDRGEPIRAFVAKVQGKASTCSFNMDCTRAACKFSMKSLEYFQKNLLNIFKKLV